MGKTIIHSVLLFDGRSIYPDSTVIFDGDTGIINSVYKSSGGPTPFPSDATAIDGRGYTLMPGLIEAHMHAFAHSMPPEVSQLSALTSPLRCGVTTVCDMHSDPDTVHALQRKVREELEQARIAGSAGRVTLSDLKSSLLGATIEGGWPKPVVLGENPSPELQSFVATWPNVTVESAADFVRSSKAKGAHYIKLMQENCRALAMPTGAIPTATMDLQKAVVRGARAENMLVVGHAISLDMTEVVLNAGADGLTHTFVDQAPPDSIVDLYKKTGAFVIPTLAVLASLTSEEQALRNKFAEIAHSKGIIDDFQKQNMVETLGNKAPEAKLEYAYQTVRRLREEGIDVVAGTDSVLGLKGTAIGPSLWMELEMYVDRCGMSILNALASVTSVSAHRFGFVDRGLVAEGRRADLILIRGDVTEKLQRLWDGTVAVWKEGVKSAGI